LNVKSGASFVNQTSGSGTGASATLTVGTMTRSAGATVSFVSISATNQALNSAFNRILVNNLGAGVAMVNGILPWATVGTPGATPNQYDFATFAASGASNSIAAFTNYKT